MTLPINLIDTGHPVDYVLAKALNRFDSFALLVIDDIGYVRKDEAETLVLFELVMHRYERPVVTTVAAVVRLVDHSTLIQINGESKCRRGARRVGGPAKA